MVRKFPPKIRYPHLEFTGGKWSVICYKSCVDALWHNKAVKWAEEKNRASIKR